MLEDASWFAPWMETQIAERLPWAQTGAKVSFDRFPDIGEYQHLIVRYRAERLQ